MNSGLLRVRGCAALLWVAMLKINSKERREGDLSFSAFSILKMLYMSQKGKIRMQTIAKVNGVSKSTATDYIDNLEEKGYVVRVKDEDDQRGMYIRLTGRGEQLALDDENVLLRYLETRASNLTDEEMELFSALFSKFMGGVGTVPFPALFESVMDMKIE
jgi:DNA-binding MarR family transcriptional regulator